MKEALEILYEDNHLIAVFKPAGILVQSDGSDAPVLMDMVKAFIKVRDQKPGDVFLGLIHRLDRNVSGIILFAKTSKGASRLAKQVRERKVKKVYHALVEGVLEHETQKLTHFITKNRVDKKAIATLKPQEGGKEAILRYKIVKRFAEKTLIEVHLQTGRFHQIRAQLSAIGHPILGDYKYGATQKLYGRAIGLCSTTFAFTTATNPQEIVLTIPYPKDWN